MQPETETKNDKNFRKESPIASSAERDSKSKTAKTPQELKVVGKDEKGLPKKEHADKDAERATNEGMPQKSANRR